MDSQRAVTCVVLLLALSAGCMSQQPPPTTSTTTVETTSTSTTSTSTTTSSTSTTASTQSTTTTLFTVACNVNVDCGQITQERICNLGSVYENRIIPVCQNPATPYAKCVNTTKLSQSPIEKCTNNRCSGGECVG